MVCVLRRTLYSLIKIKVTLNAIEKQYYRLRVQHSRQGRYVLCLQMSGGETEQYGVHICCIRALFVHS